MFLRRTRRMPVGAARCEEIMTMPLPDWPAKDAAPRNESASPGAKFQVLELEHPIYSRYVIDPAGVFKEALSLGLSEMIRGRARGTGRDYITALRLTLDVWAAAEPELVDDLFTDTASARKAVMRMLRANGCTFRRGHLPDGSLSVVLLDRDGTPARRGHQRLMLALLTLKHVYVALQTLGRWPHDNPLLVDRHRQFAQLMAAMPTPLGGHPRRYAGSQFIVAGTPSHYPIGDCTLYAPHILAAAEAWPPGIAAATRLLVACACRASEVWALTLGDWAVHDFGNRLACPDKGSAEQRVKTLFLRERDHTDLQAWVDGGRADATGLTLAAARRRARQHGAESLADAPLFLGPRGRSITAGTYRDWYFRPAMTRLGLNHVVTPHRPRHEKAFRALTRIHEIATSHEQAAQLVQDFADLMGWRSGPQMADYYAPQVKMQTRQSLFALLDDDDPESAPPALRDPLVSPSTDPLLTAFYGALEP